MSEQIQQNQRAKTWNQRTQEDSSPPVTSSTVYQENKEQLDAIREIIADLLSENRDGKETIEIFLSSQRQGEHRVLRLTAQDLVDQFLQPGGE